MTMTMTPASTRTPRSGGDDQELANPGAQAIAFMVFGVQHWRVQTGHICGKGGRLTGMHILSYHSCGTYNICSPPFPELPRPQTLLYITSKGSRRLIVVNISICLGLCPLSHIPCPGFVHPGTKCRPYARAESAGPPSHNKVFPPSTSVQAAIRTLPSCDTGALE